MREPHSYKELQRVRTTQDHRLRAVSIINYRGWGRGGGWPGRVEGQVKALLQPANETTDVQTQRNHLGMVILSWADAKV